MLFVLCPAVLGMAAVSGTISPVAADTMFVLDHRDDDTICLPPCEAYFWAYPPSTRASFGTPEGIFSMFACPSFSASLFGESLMYGRRSWTSGRSLTSPAPRLASTSLKVSFDNANLRPTYGVKRFSLGK